MVQRDVRNHANLRVEGVRRVVPAPEPRLEDPEVRPVVPEKHGCQDHAPLEVSEADAPDQGLQAGADALELRLVGLPSVQSEPLGKSAYVRRDGRAHVVSHDREQRFEADAGGAFPVRAGDDDVTIGFFRAAQEVEGPPHPFEAEDPHVGRDAVQNHFRK